MHLLAPPAVGQRVFGGGLGAGGSPGSDLPSYGPRRPYRLFTQMECVTTSLLLLPDKTKTPENLTKNDKQLEPLIYAMVGLPFIPPSLGDLT